MTDQALKHEIEQYSGWRSKLSVTIQRLSSFLKDNNVTDLRTHHQFESLLGALADDYLSVAFVAEFSRGKSEMINTIFFGGYDQRILPSGSGRTTMCPTELMYDPNRPSSVRLLPIESRADERALYELKDAEHLWEEIFFNVDDEKAISQAMEGMTENKLVSKEHAKKLKFNIKDENDNEFGLPTNKHDEVEIPRWRHAIINLPHPLLKQGLVILDTPGLNAIGSEPELTINQLATAHTVVFILSIDTGVTATDLELWQQHLGGDVSNTKKATNVKETAVETDQSPLAQRKLVALNKIDGLWDGIRSEQEINAEIDKQVALTAKTLNIDPANIFPVSAQKGLVGRLSGDQELIKRSRIKGIETAIAQRLIPEKKQIVVEKVRESLEGIVETAAATLRNRLKDADAHIDELKQISTKNTDVISHIMLKVQSEKNTLESDMQRYQALRSVYHKETRKLVGRLSDERLERLIVVTKNNMSQCVSSITLHRTITKYFEKLNQHLDEAIEQADGIAVLSEKISSGFEKEHGIANFRVRRLRLEKYKYEVTRLEQKYSHLKHTRTLFFREQMSITNRFYDSVCTASRKIYGMALRDANHWNNNLMVPMETYVREHHTQLRRRLESVKRIHRASDTVDTRLKELRDMQSELHSQHSLFLHHRQRLNELLVDPTPEHATDLGDGAEIVYLGSKKSFSY